VVVKQRFCGINRSVIPAVVTLRPEMLLTRLLAAPVSAVIPVVE
jgi:hypothetical protein